jgi:hypothetical protein
MVLLDELISSEEYPHYVAHMCLYSADKEQERTLVINPQVVCGSDTQDIYKKGALHQSLVGNLMSPCYVLKDLDGTPGYFFVFPEVSCRITGKYRLQFSVFNVKRYIK